MKWGRHRGLGLRLLIRYIYVYCFVSSITSAYIKTFTAPYVQKASKTCDGASLTVTSNGLLTEPLWSGHGGDSYPVHCFKFHSCLRERKIADRRHDMTASPLPRPLPLLFGAITATNPYSSRGWKIVLREYICRPVRNGQLHFPSTIFCEIQSCYTQRWRRLRACFSMTVSYCISLSHFSVSLFLFPFWIQAFSFLCTFVPGSEKSTESTFSTQLNWRLRTQVSDTSMSASLTT